MRLDGLSSTRATKMPHLEERVLNHAMYVGRRLDLAWRALDYRATLWIGDAFQDPRELAADDAAELTRLLDAAPSLRFDNPAGAAAAHLQFAISVIDDERFARSRVQSAILLFVARRSFSAYRVA